MKQQLDRLKTDLGDREREIQQLVQQLHRQDAEYAKVKACEKAKADEIEMLCCHLQEQEYTISQLKKEIEKGKENMEHHTRILKRETLKAKEEKGFEIKHLKDELQKAVDRND